MLFNFFVGMFWFLFLFCFGQLIFKGTASNEQVYDDIGVLFRLISISTPFQYFQLVTNRFFLIVNYPLPIIIGAIIGIVVEVVFMCIFCLGMGWISGGIALSYSLSQISVVVFNMTMYLFFNPCKESIIAFNFKETFDGMWEYIKFSLKVGPILFFNMIVVITIAYIALIVSSEASSVFIVFQTFSTMMYIFGTCTSQANNIEINRALGRKKLKPLWKIFLASLTVDGLFLVLAVVLTSTLYSKIMSAYTTETDILMGLESIKVYLISNIVICVTISVFSEGLSSLNHVLFPTINLFLSRFVIFIGLSIILAKTTDLGLISIALSFTIGSAVNLLANSIKMIFVLKEYYNQGAELEKIEKK